MGSRIRTPKYSDGLVALITGSKGVGKSTFAKTLANFCNDHDENKNGAVFWLDLDPGQPEFSPPGQLSLVLLRGPVIGPAYTHCFHNQDSKSDHRVLLAHNVGANSPKDDPEYYLAAAAELFARYNFSAKNGFWKSSALIINSPGWITRDGLDITKQLISMTTPTHVVYIHDRFPTQAGGHSTRNISIETLSETAASLNITFIDLPSAIPPDTVQSRTALERRHMSSISYFHRIPRFEAGIQDPIWTAQPLCERTPWVVPYSSILGILFTNGRPAPGFCFSAIDRSVLALVLLDDSVADALASSDTIRQHGPEELPYIPASSGGLLHQLNPSTSSCLGLVYLQGVNVQREELYLVTPLGAETRRFAMEKTRRGTPRCVLQAPGFGASDAPTWAHLEEVVGRETVKERPTRGPMSGSDASGQEAEEDLSIDWVGEGELEMDEESSSDEEEDEVVVEEELPPYVEVVGRDAAPAKVWRERKNIGTGRKTRR